MNKDERAEEQKVMGQGAGPCKAAQKGFSGEVLFDGRNRASLLLSGMCQVEGSPSSAVLRIR